MAKEEKFVLERIPYSIELSKVKLNFLFKNLRTKIENGIDFFLREGKSVLILDKWGEKLLHKYIPSDKMLVVEEKMKGIGYEYLCYFHNHNYFGLERYVDDKNSIYNLPSAEDLWFNNIPYVGIIRNFDDYSDLRIFQNRRTDYSYPPNFFITIKTEMGNGSRVIFSNRKIQVVDEEKLEILDNGYIMNAIKVQSS